MLYNMWWYDHVPPLLVCEVDILSDQLSIKNSAIRLAAEKKTSIDICKILGVGERTLRRYKQNDDEFRRKFNNASDNGVIELMEKPLHEDFYLNPIIRADIISLLKKSSYTLDNLSKEIGVTNEQMQSALDNLSSYGYNVERIGNTYHLGKFIDGSVKSETNLGDKTTFRFGLVSDTHLASHYARLDVLNDAYDEFEKQGIDTVLHTGNLLEGYLEKINKNEVLFSGLTDQVTYCMDVYPQKEGITTSFITGQCHAGGWYGKEIGLNVGEYIEMLAHRLGRTDFKFLGHIKHDLIIGEDTRIRLAHPGGGSSYALSYAPQKHVERGTYIDDMPDMVIFGHFHKQYQFRIQKSHVIGAGCCQNQSSFMQKHSVIPNIGFHVVELDLDQRGKIRGVQAKWYDYAPSAKKCCKLF